MFESYCEMYVLNFLPGSGLRDGVREEGLLAGGEVERVQRCSQGQAPGPHSSFQGVRPL